MWVHKTDVDLQGRATRDCRHRTAALAAVRLGIAPFIGGIAEKSVRRKRAAISCSTSALLFLKANSEAHEVDHSNLYCQFRLTSNRPVRNREKDNLQHVDSLLRHPERGIVLLTFLVRGTMG